MLPGEHPAFPKAPMTADWASTVSLADIAAWLAGASKVAILTHAKPDGDAIGSSISIARALNLAAARPVATCFYSGPMPSWHQDLVAPEERKLVGDILPTDLASYDRILVVDTGSWTQLEYAGAALTQSKDDIAIIDHHAHGDPAVSDRRYIDVQSAAACQPVAELCRLVLKLDSLAKLPPRIAEPLYFGTATDTGWFRHSNVTPQVLRHAADLLAAGVDPARLYSLSEQRDRAQRTWLMGRALAGMELLENARLAVALLTRADFDQVKGEQGDVYGFTDHMLAIETVEVACVLTETDAPPSPVTKASFRSKTTSSTIDVNLVAQTFGGGGHKQAAGARIKTDPLTAKKLAIEAMRKALS